MRQDGCFGIRAVRAGCKRIVPCVPYSADRCFRQIIYPTVCQLTKTIFTNALIHPAYFDSPESILHLKFFRLYTTKSGIDIWGAGNTVRDPSSKLFASSAASLANLTSVLAGCRALSHTMSPATFLLCLRIPVPVIRRKIYTRDLRPPNPGLGGCEDLDAQAQELKNRCAYVAKNL